MLQTPCEEWCLYLKENRKHAFTTGQVGKTVQYSDQNRNNRDS